MTKPFNLQNAVNSNQYNGVRSALMGLPRSLTHVDNMWDELHYLREYKRNQMAMPPIQPASDAKILLPFKSPHKLTPTEYGSLHATFLQQNYSIGNQSSIELLWAEVQHYRSQVGAVVPDYAASSYKYEDGERVLFVDGVRYIRQDADVRPVVETVLFKPYKGRPVSRVWMDELVNTRTNKQITAEQLNEIGKLVWAELSYYRAQVGYGIELMSDGKGQSFVNEASLVTDTEVVDTKENVTVEFLGQLTLNMAGFDNRLTKLKEGIDSGDASIHKNFVGLENAMHAQDTWNRNQVSQCTHLQERVRILEGQRDAQAQIIVNQGSLIAKNKRVLDTLLDRFNATVERIGNTNDRIRNDYDKLNASVLALSAAEESRSQFEKAIKDSELTVKDTLNSLKWTISKAMITDNVVDQIKAMEPEPEIKSGLRYATWGGNKYTLIVNEEGTCDAVASDGVYYKAGYSKEYCIKYLKNGQWKLI